MQGIYGRNGGDFTSRFPGIAAAALELPTRSCIIDGELIAAGRHGQPDFLALLHGRHVPTCVYCFDLIELNGRDLREESDEAAAKQIMPRPFIAGTAVCFGVVVLTHVAETFRILPAMGWGLPNSAGHYLDLASAVLGCTLLALGLGAWAYRFLRRRLAK